MTKKIKDQWAGVGYGRKRRAHFWTEWEANEFFAISRCGKTILKEQLRSATGLYRCKHCDKAETIA